MPTNFVEKIEEIVELLRHNPNLILYGPPGTGKTYTAKAVALYLLGGEEAFDNDSDDWANELDKYKELGRWKIVQFHPSYNYDDFVIGIEAKTEDKQVVFEKVWRALGEMSRRVLVSLVLGKEKLKEFVKKDKKEIYEQAKREWKEGKIEDTSPFVLIIDEINRANLPAVLGELIYALEYRGEEIDIMYGEKLIIPPNLYIIGTMNTADRSAGRIDYAIRRRFTFYPMHADDEKAELTYGKPLMEAVNGFIEKNVSPDYEPEDIKIGHTYFMIKDKEKTDEEKRKEIAYKFLYQVVPLLYEYIQDGLIIPKESFKKDKIGINVENGEVQFEIKDWDKWKLRGGKLVKGDDSVRITEFKAALKAALTGNYPLSLALYKLLEKAVQVKDKKELYEGMKESIIRNLIECKEDDCIEMFYKALNIFEKLSDGFAIKTGESTEVFIKNRKITFRLEEEKGEKYLLATVRVEKKKDGKKETQEIKEPIKDSKGLKDFLQKVGNPNNPEKK